MRGTHVMQTRHSAIGVCDVTREAAGNGASWLRARLAGSMRSALVQRRRGRANSRKSDRANCQRSYGNRAAAGAGCRAHARAARQQPPCSQPGPPRPPTL
ncbi:hypothetical protein O0L34_g1544 [Tuta absoluta]|nr:hypothetical protein O0L34_g1544 [Tuta absoluta]